MMIKGLEQLTYQERMRELDCSVWRREISGDHMNVYKYLKGRCEEDRARRFSVVLRVMGSWRPALLQRHWGRD